MTRRTSYQLSILFNTLIFVMELFTICNRFLCFVPYTDEIYTPMVYQDLYMHFDIAANILLGLSCLFMALRGVYYLSDMKDYKRNRDFFIIFKLSAVVMSLIVFISTYTYFLPCVYNQAIDGAVVHNVYKNALYIHCLDFRYSLWAITVLPLFSMLTFIFFDRDRRVKLVKFLYVWIPMAAYFVTIILLTFYKIIVSPYKVIDPIYVDTTYEFADIKLFVGTMVFLALGSYALAVVLLLTRNIFSKMTERHDKEMVDSELSIPVPQELLDRATIDALRIKKEEKRNKKKEEKKNKKEAKKKKKVDSKKAMANV